MYKIIINKNFRFYKNRDLHWFGTLKLEVKTSIVPIIGQDLIYSNQDDKIKRRLRVQRIDVDTINNTYIVHGKNVTYLNASSVEIELPSRDSLTIDFNRLNDMVKNEYYYSEEDAKEFLDNFISQKWEIEISSTSCPESFKEYHKPFTASLFKTR